MEFAKEMMSYKNKNLNLHVYNPDIRRDQDQTLHLPKAGKYKHLVMIEASEAESFILSAEEMNRISSIFFDTFHSTLSWTFVMPIAIHIFVDCSEEEREHEKFLRMHAFLVGLIAGFIERKSL